jgi:hypothetical protein
MSQRAKRERKIRQETEEEKAANDKLYGQMFGLAAQMTEGNGNTHDDAEDEEDADFDGERLIE